MTTALTRREEQDLTVAPQTPRGILTREALQEAAEQRKLLAQYVKEQMIEGVDYGVIPGTDKRTLLKPGAEKLVDLFRCTPKFTLVKSVEDFDKGLFTYTFRVRLLQRDANVVLAEGYGSANSREGRYRWRNAQLKCPDCEKESILKSKDKPEYFCWKKRGGCGATFPLTDERISGQQLGKVENEDIATQANTILKVAKKRCLVDGSIALARVSDLFTQDLDDTGQHQEQEHAQEKPAAAAKAAPKSNGKPATKKDEWRVANGVLELANDYGFAVGEKNKDLWAFAAKVLNNKPPKEWGDEEYKAMEKALSEAMGLPNLSQPAAVKPEDDIPY